MNNNKGKFRLAIVSTHPIQYNAPWFSLLAQRPELQVKVFYTWSQSEAKAKYDPGFGKVIEWDIPLLEGYEFEFVDNIAKDPGSHHFKGIDNPTLNKKIELWSPTDILIIGWSYKSHLSCMRHFKGKVKVLFRGDSTLLDEKPGLKQVARRLFLKYVYSFVDIALYVGENNKDYFLAHGLKEKQLIYASHAIDNNRFGGEENDECRAKEWRKNIGIPGDAFVVLFAGKLEPKKNPGFILKLADKLKSENIYFLMVGNGPLESELKHLAKDKKIIFLDFQNQKVMPLVYRLGDVFILPSDGPGETWGLAINEAMASERAVMASNKAGGAIDLIKQDLNGYIFKNSDVDEASMYLKRIIEKGNRTSEMGKESKKIINSFSFQNIVKKVVSAVQQ